MIRKVNWSNINMEARVIPPRINNNPAKSGPAYMVILLSETHICFNMKITSLGPPIIKVIAVPGVPMCTLHIHTTTNFPVSDYGATYCNTEFIEKHNEKVVDVNTGAWKIGVVEFPGFEMNNLFPGGEEHFSISHGFLIHYMS